MAGERTIRIKIDGDGKGLIVTARTVEKEIDRLGRNVDKANKRFVSAAGGFTKLALAASTLSTGTSALAGLGSTLVAASGALIGLPAIAAAGGAALATIALGGEGIQLAFAGIHKSLDPLKAQVSATFEHGLAPAVDDLNRLLPKTSSGFAAIAREMSGVVRESAAAAALPENVEILNTVLGRTSGLMSGVRRAAGPLTSALFDVVEVGSQGFGNLGDRIADSANEFAGFIAHARQSGQLRGFLDNGIAALRSLWQTLKDIGAIVGGVFSGISDGAGGVGAALRPAIQAMRQFVESTRGQAFLRQIGAALAEIGEAVGGTLSAGLHAVAPLVGPMAQAFAMLATAASGILIPALNVLAPILQVIGNFMSENAGFVQFLVTALGGLGAAYLAVHGSIKIVTQATTVWSTVTGLASQKTAALGTSFTNMSRVARIASLSMGAIGVVLALVGTAMSLFGEKSGEAAQRQQELAGAGKRVNDAIREQGGIINNAVRVETAKALADEGILQKAKALGVALPRVTDAVLGEGNAYGSLKGDIEGIIASKEAELRQSQDRSGKTQAAIQGEIDAYRVLLGEINGFIGAKSDAKLAEEAATEASNNATSAIERQQAAMQALQIRTLATNDATRGYQQAVDDATQAARENTGGLNANKTAFDLNTQAGRNKSAALDNLIVKSNAYIAKLKENKASSGTVTAATNQTVASFLRSARQMGITGDAAVRLANKYGVVPKNVTTTVQLRAWQAAVNALQRVKNQLDRIPSEKSVTVSTYVRGVGNLGGHQFLRATGGPVLPGRSYVVGERGPEIFRAPNTGGTIVPNHQAAGQIGGNVEVSVFIDGQKFDGRIETKIRENNRSIRRAATAGTGGAR